MGRNALAYNMNRVTRKNTSCDKTAEPGLLKKNGSGKGNWGRPGDEIGAPFVLDRADPMYDPLEMSLEQALREHESSYDLDR
mmetsp:Transcript_44350/g.104266  ORF Transcript_44350/g.104266 Transcript_44350/m.104266 type:complete len:82 (-) Transcript_44350:218-463(-)